MRGIGLIAFGSAVAGLAVIHLLPSPLLHATTGALIPYRPWNFLSEFARTQYAPLMDATFALLALGVLALAATLWRRCRSEAILLVVAGVAVGMLAIFPTDIADMRTDWYTCGFPGRAEPCTLVGRVHNPLSTLVFVPIIITILSFCARSRRGEREWRRMARLAAGGGVVALCGMVGTTTYLHLLGWHGRLWNGLTQRSLVFPAIAWLLVLLASYRTEPD